MQEQNTKPVITQVISQILSGESNKPLQFYTVKWVSLTLTALLTCKTAADRAIHKGLVEFSHVYFATWQAVTCAWKNVTFPKKTDLDWSVYFTL